MRVLFALPIRILLLVIVFYFFTQIWEKTTHEKSDETQWEKSEGRFIVLLMRAVEYFVYTSHFTVVRTFFLSNLLFGCYLQHILTFMTFMGSISSS